MSPENGKLSYPCPGRGGAQVHNYGGAGGVRCRFCGKLKAKMRREQREIRKAHEKRDE